MSPVTHLADLHLFGDASVTGWRAGDAEGKNRWIVLQSGMAKMCDNCGDVMTSAGRPSSTGRYFCAFEDCRRERDRQRQKRWRDSQAARGEKFTAEQVANFRRRLNDAERSAGLPLTTWED